MEITVLGHKAKIDHIFTRAACPPWQKEDQICVWIDLVESVEGLSGYSITLPAKKYERDEFIKRIEKEAADQLERSIAEQKANHADMQERKKRQEELDKMVAGLEGYLE